MKDKEEKTQEDFEADAERADDMRQSPEWEEGYEEGAADATNVANDNFEKIVQMTRESLLAEIEEWIENNKEDYDGGTKEDEVWFEYVDPRELKSFLESKRKR